MRLIALFYSLSCLIGRVRAVGAVKKHLCKHAAIYTPHDLVDSEETRYLFGVISSLQMIWCEFIDVLVTENNACQTNDCFASGSMATMIQRKGTYSPHIRVISASAGDPHLRPVGEPEGELTGYDVFVLFGTEKLPAHAGIGSGINFYVCDFPNDLDTMLSETQISYLSTYDGVITPSYYSFSFYLAYIKPYLSRGKVLGLPHPDILMNLPPVPPLVKPKTLPQFKAFNNTVGISFYGDFFPGDNNNGHDQALMLLSRLNKDIPFVHLKLYMLGKQSNVAGTEEYISGLKATAAKSKLDVEFIINPTWSKKSSAIGTSQMLWDMGGIHMVGKDDPRVGAITDTAVIQAMGIGVLVIAQNHGVATSLIKHGKHGFLASGLNDYYRHSVYILQSSSSQLQSIKDEASRRVELFKPLVVITKLADILKTSILRETYHKLAAKYTPAVRKIRLSVAPAGTTDNIAVILLTSFHTSTDFTIRQNMRKLGPGWQLSVWLPTYNEDYYKEALRDIENIQFNSMPHHLMGDSVAESVLLKSGSFWGSLPAKKAFIFQSNSVISNPNIGEFMSFDFIGAPYRDNSKAAALAISGSCSLRTISAMKKVVEACKDWGYTDVREEQLFWKCMQKPGAYKLPSAQKANDFAISKGYPGLHDYQTPICLDEPWNYPGHHKEANIQRWMEQAVEDLN